MTNVGNPMAMVVASVTRTSRNEWRKMAAMMPAVNPMTIWRAMAASPSFTVLPSFSPRMVFTDRRKVYDSPMSPRTKRPT